MPLEAVPLSETRGLPLSYDGVWGSCEGRSNGRVVGSRSSPAGKSRPRSQSLELVQPFLGSATPAGPVFLGTPVHAMCA